MLPEHPGAVLRLQTENSRGLRGEQQDILPPRLYEGQSAQSYSCPLSLFQCHVCDEPLRNSYLFFQNKPICEKHYKETQGSCCVCGNVIEGTYYQLNDKIYCHDDYMAHMGDTCAKCSSSIEGEHVKITGSSFHPSCFKCEVRERARAVTG